MPHKFNLKIFLGGVGVFVFQVVFLNQLPLHLNYLNLFLIFIILIAYHGNFAEALFLGVTVGFFQDLSSSGLYCYFLLYPFIIILVRETQKVVNGEERWWPYAFAAFFYSLFYVAGRLLLYFFGL